MSENYSDSSSYSESSDDSNLDISRTSNTSIFDLISWNSVEGKLIQFKEAFQQFSSNNRLFVIKSRCLSSNCGCNFKNYDILLAKVFVNLKLLVGKWCKLKFSKTVIPETDKLGTFIFFKDFQGYYEIMNENLEVIPFWSNVNQIIQNTPKSFIIRKDVKCLYIKEASDDPSIPHLFESTIVKAGTILSYSHNKKYLMKKGRKVKDQILVKCKDLKGNNFYLSTDEVVYASPIAGSENISGAHTFDSIIEKFRFPLNIKPLFLVPPVPNLPCTDRHFLQLTERHQLDLIFVTPASESKRLFIITPALFEDHVFTIGEFLSSSLSKYNIPELIYRQIENHQTKINDFFLKCHKYDSLSYLLKHSENISKVPQKFETGTSEFDDTYLEVEDIYFFIRNGYFPRNSIKMKLKKSDSQLDSKPNNNNNNNKVPSVKSSDSEKLSVNDKTSSSSEKQTSESDNNSSESSSTSISTESDFTSSTALKMSKEQFKKQAKSVPLSSRKNKIKNNDLNTSQCHIDLSVDDMLNISAVNMGALEEVENLAVEDNEIMKKQLEFYQRRLLEPQKFKISDAESFSLKNTAV